MTTSDGEPIMTVKLEPPGLPPWWVVRERLRERLDAGPGRRLTVVTGPAGSGKSSLVADWTASGRAGGRVAWLTLEPGDDQPGIFWPYVVAALRRAGAEVQGEWRPEAERSFLVRLVVALASEPRPVVLVLDNVHALTRASIIDGLHFLVEHAGPQLRCVLIGRTDPPLPLHRYRLAGSITEIRHDELAFTPAEADALLTAHGTRLGPNAVAELTEQTHGWAAALRLEARALPMPGDKKDELADYIRNELLGEQTAATRELLLRTCVAERLPAGLAVELSGRRDAAQVLDRLAHQGIFVSARAGGERTYVHHPQVRGVLLAALGEGPVDRITGLHRRAARWYAGFDRHGEALPHALRAQEWALAATSVVRGLGIAEVLNGEGAAAFTPMPPDLDLPEAAVVAAAVAHYLDDPEACAKHLLRAGEMAGGRGVALPLSLAAVDVARARRHGGPDDLAATAEAAWRLLDGALVEGAAVPAGLASLIRLARAESLLWQRDLVGACAVLQPSEHDGAEVLGRLALAEALCGRLRRADEHARRALDRSHDDDGPGDAAADVALAWARADEYDLTAARVHAEQAAARLEETPDALLGGLLALVRARVHRGNGDVAKAAEAIAAAPAGPRPAWLTEVLDLARDALLAPGRPPAAGTTNEHAIAEATAAVFAGETVRARAVVATLGERPGLPLEIRVNGWLITAAAELGDGRRDRARRALHRALGLAEPERLRRPLLEAATPVRRFLREDRELAVRHDWLGVVPRAATAPQPAGPPPQAAPAAPVMVEPLTAKETEVLGYLAQLFSTEEIARTMYVSVNTVKTHVRGVLRKLAATRRNEAVRRARDLGLL
ncbi:LuxR C-terminal-related transcriptional regulator [Paractinoplanes deccanensis]|uniref:LuxR C-terminal-related transcriptional regulator n=1 Tax=Paractinoplanes deccanensis TaxID=113561 RepID=UPI00366DE1C8